MMRWPLLTLGFAFGAFEQLWLAVEHARTGDRYGLDVAVAGVCAVAAMNNAIEWRRARKGSARS